METISSSDIETRIGNLLERMTLAEKVGQLCLVNSPDVHSTERFKRDLADGRVGGILNQVNPDLVNELQNIAANKSRLGIPLLVGRDVIHGFKTIFPIPLGQAASWNPDLIEQSARMAAVEAVKAGINWTYAPMLDVARDPRWGRVAESFGEDPYLISILGAAMVRGFQDKDLTRPESIAACAKHFAGYGASESGRDYNTTNIPENELRNVHLPPFRKAIDSGVLSIMASFSDLDGIPATANTFLLKQILRDEWGFDGFVVSDWEAVSQLTVHGLTDGDKEAALQAAKAGVDMEMASTTYADHLETLLDEGKVSLEQIDTMVANILRAKFRLGLFERPLAETNCSDIRTQDDRLATARELARQSIVLLSNKNRLLPISADTAGSIAVIGPLADDGQEQLGTWVFDGDPTLSQTPLQAIKAAVSKKTEVRFARAMKTSRSNGDADFTEAVELARRSDVSLLFLGEEAILAGEAHCRADISLPGDQEKLIEAVHSTGTPVVLVVMTGRPLTLGRVVDKVDAVLCAWHPGSMTGPAIADLIFGKESPSGKLPITFPRVTGQIPIYYAHKNTGRPPTPDTVVHLDDIEPGAPQHSIGNTSFHLDIEHTPLFPFGHGLSYTEFEYTNLAISADTIRLGDSFTISTELVNVGEVEATEVAQLYIRDLVGSVTRPVKELKGFRRFRLKPGEKVTVSFVLSTDDLAFYGRDQKLITEPGKFHAWIGSSSETDLRLDFEII